MIGNILSIFNKKLFVNAFKVKKSEYLMFIMGRFPNNIKDGMKIVTDKDSIFRFSVGESTMMIRFSSEKTISEIEKIFNRTYENHIDSYFLYKTETTGQCKFLNQVHFNHLYSEDYHKMDTQSTIDLLGDFIKDMNQIKMSVFNRIQNVNDSLELINDKNETNTNNPIVNEKKKISMGDINPILDKIKNHGMTSLTDREQQLLKQYATND